MPKPLHRLSGLLTYQQCACKGIAGTLCYAYSQEGRDGPLVAYEKLLSRSNKSSLVQELPYSSIYVHAYRLSLQVGTVFLYLRSTEPSPLVYS
jgi:hypothetical protein